MAITRRSSSKGEEAKKADQPGASSKRRPGRARTQDGPPLGSAPAKTSAMTPAKTSARTKADDPIVEDIPRGDTPGGPAKETGGVDEALAASQSDLAKLQKARRSRVIKAIALTAIALVFIMFILQNAKPIDLRVLAWTVSVRLIWVIVAAALLGALAGYLVGRPDKNLLLHGPSRRQEDTR